MHVHLVFSTKNRNPVLHDGVREDLHRYMASVLQSQHSPAMLINSVEDHAHVLFELGRTVALADVVEEVKKSSSKWIKTQGPEFEWFYWQNGYGAFAVSFTDIERVRTYIAYQREHHKKQPFPDEYRTLLDQHGVRYDERYLWD